MTTLNNKEQLNKKHIKEILGLEPVEFINNAYELVLHRKPDPTGLQSALLYLNEGGSKLKYLYKMIYSPEAIATGRDKDLTQTIVSLYKVVKLPVIGIYIENKFVLDAKQSLKHKRLELEKLNKNKYTSNIMEQVLLPEQKKPARKIKKREYKKRINGACLWMDLTTTMEWTGGVVGIIRAELEVASALKKIRPGIRFSMQLGNGFIEIDNQKLGWLFDAENIADAYIEKFKRIGPQNEPARRTYEYLNIDAKNNSELFHPYEPDDIVFCMGWMDSQKEVFFDKIKFELPQLYISYLVYDTILINENTTQFYDRIHAVKFSNYLEWISNSCSLIFYGGETAKQDTESFQKKLGWASPLGVPVHFGSDIVKNYDDSDDFQILSKLNLKSYEFIMTVGSIEPRKNHETLYKAMLMALEIDALSTPMLVIVGNPAGRVDDLMNHLTRNPKLKGKILLLRPTDKELSVLYRHCAFTLLPSLYEGWSLTLPESLGQGKFCLACDTPPLVEIGRNMIEYVKPYDVKSWATSILRLSRDKELLKTYEKNIREKWPQTSWKDTANRINEVINKEIKKLPYVPSPPTIWYDMSLSYLLWSGGISGVIRAELTYARHLKKIYKQIKFFAQDANSIFEIPAANLLWLFEEGDLSTAYQSFRQYWDSHESNNTGFRSPYRYPGSNRSTHEQTIEQFPDNSIIIFTGIDFDLNAEGEPRRCLAAREASKNGENITLSHLVYDFTPFIIPQCHKVETCAGYEGFIKYISNEFDYIIYGGRTAMLDSEVIQKKLGWSSPKCSFVEFGSDIQNGKYKLSLEEENKILNENDIQEDFILTVGTIEPRKNHEMLYKAYLYLIESGITDLPQFIFVGKPGWLVDDFLTTFNSDSRIQKYIKIISPDDTFLDVLYRRCKFTVLASMYEGWSLTLPESLSYGKFCLTADTPPLVEVGRNLVEYINPYDTKEWGDRILHYYKNPDIVRQKEDFIKNEWQAKTWLESSGDLLKALLNFYYSNLNLINSK
ncbi:glycosyltransferase [Rhodoferax sp.]|uniref:glycosyltransferase n=1 Tax=Rhodoferax sp. TaxID=50421 RepID=UPI0025D19B39|nr:glycosyltransferase [Rhodoferax sp.]